MWVRLPQCHESGTSSNWLGTIGLNVGSTPTDVLINFLNTGRSRIELSLYFSIIDNPVVING